MIRGLMAAHMSQAELFTKTILLNDRKVGALAPLCQASYMITGNRSVHMALELQSDVSNKASKSHDLETLRLWLTAFRDLQLTGIDALPTLLDVEAMVADKLLLVGREICLAWLPRRYGLYLHRGMSLYRVQPLIKPHHVFDRDFLADLDFYSFVPETDDLILVLQPGFVDAFHASELEQVFSANTQLPIMMTQLTQRARTYGIKMDEAWMGMQVQRIESSVLHQKRKRALAELESSESARIVSIASQIAPSLVVPVALQNKVFLPFDDDTQGQLKSAPRHRESAPKSLRPSTKKKIIKPDAMRSGTFAPDYSVYEAYGKKTPKWWLSLLHLDLKQALMSGWQKLKTLPNQSWRVQLVAVSLIVMLVLLFTLVGVRLFGTRENEAPTTKVVVATPTPAVTIPEPTNLKIKVEVKAQSLAIKRFADAGADLVAMVQRGDFVIQLAQPNNGWVYVELADGRTGYAFAQYLLPEPTPIPTENP